MIFNLIDRHLDASGCCIVTVGHSGLSKRHFVVGFGLGSVLCHFGTFFSELADPPTLSFDCLSDLIDTQH
jgi:hypothetical protein